MLDDLRKPFFILALVLIGLAMLLELGAPLVLGVNPTSVPPEQASVDGFGVASLAVLDALLILSVGLMGVALLIPERVHGRLQGLVTLVVALLVLLASLALLFAGIQLVTVMVSLFFAAFFGTAAYLLVWGDFDRDGAAMILGLLMMLKLGFAVCLVLAHQRFLENKGLVLLTATSLLAVLIVGFLHALVPGILVSITDMVGAIIVAVLALIWAIVFLIGSLTSIVKAVA